MTTAGRMHRAGLYPLEVKTNDRLGRSLYILFLYEMDRRELPSRFHILHLVTYFFSIPIVLSMPQENRSMEKEM